VNLYNATGTLIDSTITNATGYYDFTNLNPGGYYVEFILPSGYVFSPQDQGSNDSVDSDANTTTGKTEITTLSAGENDDTWDCGMHQLSPDIEIEKTVWNGTAWNDSITANIGDTVRFNITIHNNGTE